MFVAVDLSRPEYYINRELSWLDFNRRVLEEARDERNPLLERVRFLGIVADILDEFFEVRVAGILQVQESGGTSTGPDRLTPEEQLAAIARTTHELVDAQYRCWNEELLPALAAEKIHLHEPSELRGEQLAFIRRYWRGELEPILTPIVIDPAHPFPRVLNKALCIGVLLEQDGGTAVGVVTVPRVLPRILALPDAEDGAVHMVTLAGIVAHYLQELFEGYGVNGYGSFRVTRNSELYVNEEEADNLLEEIAESLEQRRKGDVVRLEIEAKIAAPLVVAGRVLGRKPAARLQVRPRAEAAASEQLQPGQELRDGDRGRGPPAASVGGPVEGVGALHGPALPRLQHIPRAPRDHVDHPAHGVGAVERRRGAAHHLHALHDLGVHGGEVLARALAEGAVVEAHAIDHQEYLAPGERAHEGGPLSRRGLLHQHAGFGDEGVEQEAVRLFAQLGALHQVDRHGELVGGGGQAGRRHDQWIQLDGRRVRIRLIRRRLRHGGTGGGEKGGRPNQDAHRTRQLRQRDPLPVHA